jgi:hypothetical protein
MDEKLLAVWLPGALKLQQQIPSLRCEMTKFHSSQKYLPAETLG